MKAILEFNLPEEGEEHKMALHGLKYYGIIESVLEHIRTKIKNECYHDERREILEEISDLIHDELES